MTQQLFDLTGKIALVTGASRGLGQAMAVALANAGARVLCVSSKTGGCNETVTRIQENGGSAQSLACDCNDRNSLANLVADVRKKCEVNILVNNAGTIRRAPADAYPQSDWDEVMQVNADAVFYLCQAFGKEMIERRSGKIINVASLLSFSGGINVPAYTASKHAVAGITKALANEWASANVQVNAIVPGYFTTDNTEQLQQDAVRFQEISSRIPAGRWGKPDDLAGAVVFLASSASDYINGHLLSVDGGWLAR